MMQGSALSMKFDPASINQSIEIDPQKEDATS